MHLTNNAIQKNGKNYGKYENGNIISYADYSVNLSNHIISYLMVNNK